jgi:hypothetical protein
MLACCAACWIGCGPDSARITSPTTSSTAPGKTTQAANESVAKLLGSLSFRTENGRRLAVLTATNNTDKVMWVPRSDGECYGCEAVNFRIQGLASTHYDCTHYDYGLCSFPDHYEKLNPNDRHHYVHPLPEDAKGQIKMSVWAPWRTADGKMIDAETKKAALKADEVLIEEVLGAGPMDGAGQ